MYVCDDLVGWLVRVTDGGGLVDLRIGAGVGH